MNIGNSVYWEYYINVGAKVGRGNSYRIYSDIDEKSRSGNIEEVGQESVDDTGSRYITSVNKLVKCVKKVLEEVLVIGLEIVLVIN